jgi:hypothetical protein
MGEYGDIQMIFQVNLSGDPGLAGALANSLRCFVLHLF